MPSVCKGRFLKQMADTQENYLESWKRVAMVDWWIGGLVGRYLDRLKNRPILLDASLRHCSVQALRSA